MIGRKIDLLDHGFIRLIDHMGTDLSVVRNARVSYDAAWRAGEDGHSDIKLINYLYRNSHNTPFEAVVFTFEVMAPIFVLRQWHRHRTQSYNEVSARYKELPEKFYVPKPEHIGIQSKDNKQCREIEQMSNGNKFMAQTIFADMMSQQNQDAFQTYHHLLNRGVPRELARSVLPVATYSHMFATVNLHNLFNFMRERMHPHAQYEIRVYAEAMYHLIEPIVPVCADTFKRSMIDETR